MSIDMSWYTESELIPLDCPVIGAWVVPGGYRYGRVSRRGPSLWVDPDSPGCEISKPDRWCYPPDGLTFARFTAINTQRHTDWNPPGTRSVEWCDRLMFAAGRVAAEAGEAVGAVDKLVRHLRAWNGAPKGSQDELVRKVVSELADTIIFADQAITEAGGNTEQAVIETFNRKSVEYGSVLFL